MNNKLYITWSQVFERLEHLLLPSSTIVYGVPKGGMIITAFCDKWIDVTPYPEQADFILDDLIDSGTTEKYYKEKYPNAQFHALFNKQTEPELKGKWIVFPWEVDHPQGEDNIQQNITRQLQYFGEDPEREGLKGTPNRIVKSWKEIYSGYAEDPKDLLTTFKETDGYSQIVLLKNIELFSMCEHHILPFFGKAHVGYLPDGRVIGISKLARLVDIYSRRLQIQERIGEQVTNALMEYLNPQGAFCVIEATHMCMRMRGCSKQQSVMITSSLKGCFLKEHMIRSEMLSLLKIQSNV